MTLATRLNVFRRRLSIATAAVIGLACAGAASMAIGGGWGSAQPLKAPVPAFDPPSPPQLQTVVLSGGCFWGVQGVFEHVRGVKEAVAGYAGGKRATAEYELVSTGATGHAESVKVVFDPREISFGEILRIYFSVATDPTQLNKQYPDEGTQYRGDIFYLNPTQQLVAQRYIAQMDAARTFPRPIVTKVDAYTGFYPAETYHQDYLLRHPDAPYIATFDLPKVAALKALFPTDYRVTPVRVL